MRGDDGRNGQSGSFEVRGMTPETFVGAVQRAIATMDLGVKVSIGLGGDQLVVAVERLGSSVLRYDLIPCAGGFAVRLRSRRVAPLHLPFEHEFGDTVTRILERVAGKG